jgi:hypothetical protein
VNLPVSMEILSRRLLLISATVLINANTVLAADRVGDAQLQTEIFYPEPSAGQEPLINHLPFRLVIIKSHTLIRRNRRARSSWEGQASMAPQVGNSRLSRRQPYRYRCLRDGIVASIPIGRN